MKKLAYIFKWIIGIILITWLGLYLTGYDYILKGARVVYFTGHKTAFIDDYTYFDNRSIQNDAPKPTQKHKDYNKAAITSRLFQLNEELETTAYLIYKDNQLWFENHTEGYGLNSHTNSFSMAKSITTMLLGRAIEQGFVESLDQKVTNFLPGLQGEYAQEVSMGDLASMASGLSWDENYYSPFSMTAQAYYDNNIRNLIMGLEISEQPGQEFNYLSGSTQLLGMALEKALPVNLSVYLSQEFWQPMGMENYALWQLDGSTSGMEKTYCCIASNARDFAKIGLLYLNEGNYLGKHYLNSTFVQQSITPRFEASPEYGYGFWLSEIEGKSVFVMQGILGQYVIGVPEDNLLVVRLGHRRYEKGSRRAFPDDFYIYLEEAYVMLTNFYNK